MQQVRHAVRYGILLRDDQLPTAREVVEALAINPNTVLKAYRELERDGLVYSRPGLGTFVSKSAPAPMDRSIHEPLRRRLDRWLKDAHTAGLDRESAVALFTLALHHAYESED